MCELLLLAKLSTLATHTDGFYLIGDNNPEN